MPESDFALLAQAALDQGGLLSLLGAGVDQVEAAEFPFVATLYFVGRIRWFEDDLDRPHDVRIVVRDESDEVLATVITEVRPSRLEHNPRERALHSVLTVPVPIQIASPGWITWSLEVDERLISSVVLVAQQS